MDHIALRDLPLGHIADSGVVGVVSWELSGRILEANDRFLEIVGYGRADIEAGLDWERLTPARCRERDRAAVERLKNEGIARSQEKEYVRRGGSSVFARLHSAVLEDGSGRVLSILVDVTAQKEVEAELRAAIDREVAARAEAQTAVRSRDDILAIVSHDLRNPLNIVAMGVGVLESPLSDEKRAAQLGIIRRAAAGMNRLIADLMDVSQITAGRLSIDTKPIDAASICEEARAMFTPLLEKKSQELRSDCDGECGRVLADRDRIAQVLANLLGNAHKFTPEGGRIALRATPHADAVEFTVSDTGPGLGSQDLPHVFDRFWQARRVRRGGVGLGLPITKGIVDAHGGRIWVESSAGVGTTFHFTLPRVPPGP